MPEFLKPFIQGEKEGNIIQIAVVVKNLEKSIEKYAKVLGTRSWDIYTFSPGTGVRDFIWKGEVVEDFKYRIAITSFGNLQWELIEPVKNVPIYEKFLKEKGEGVHHIKQKVNEEDVERILVTGDGNLVMYSKHADPVIQDLGNYNTIEKAWLT